MPSRRKQPRRSNYLDFELQIAGGGREYSVTVVDSPVGEAHSTIYFPFDELTLENRFLALQNALLRSGGERRRTLSEEQLAVRKFGRELFDLLFSSDVRSCYDQSLREARRQEKGLRLVLRIQPPELAILPWEYLYHPGEGDYLILSTQTPIVRYLSVPRRTQSLTVQPPLRILSMVSSPSDLESLDVPREKQRIEEAIKDLQRDGLVQLKWLPGQGWRDLQRAMRRSGPWHIFHFLGHGGFDRNAGTGLVCMTDRQGKSKPLSASQLGRLLADHFSLRLVLLNACEGGRGDERDIFSSTAAALVRKGIPAVLAMQYRITDRAAIEFAQQFYEALGDGEPVDGAVAEARKAINMAVNNTVEWGTPVLYMRSPDGVLFHITERPTAKRAEIRAPELPSEDEEEREKRLCKLYTDGVSARWREDWDEACRCFEAIVRERPDHQDAATKLEEARRQSKLAGLYTQAQAAREEGDWSGALVALEKLVGEQVNYKDAADLLKRVKTQKELADLYAQARHLHRAEEWTLVVKVFAEIVALAPDYADPESLLVTAKQKVAEQQRQAELDNLHDRAVLAMEDGRWVEAGELLYQTEQLEPGYRDNDRLLTRVEVEIQREETARQCQTLYEQAQALANAGDWSQALVRMQEIQKLDSQFADPEGIAARARKEVEGLRRWEGLYSQAQAAQEAGDWAAAVGVLEALVAEAPDFSDAANLLGKARERKELAELQACAADRVKTTQRPSTPSLPRGKREAPAPSKVRSFGGVEMVYVPSGAFWMGSGDCDKRAHDSEKPQHEVFVRGFWIGRTPVTNEQYQHFVEATDHGKPGHWKGGRIPEGTETHPVVYVSWHDAQAYCRWQSERAEVEIRLPSEAEWEKAARWSDGRLYPWGDEFDKKNCNSREGGPGGTTPVGRYSPDGDSPYGLADMAGNVWEWTANEFGPYPYDGDDGREDPQAEVRRVLRGGSWDSNQRGARAAYRLHNEPSYASSSRGFRCARSGSEP